MKPQEVIAHISEVFAVYVPYSCLLSKAASSLVQHCIYFITVFHIQLQEKIILYQLEQLKKWIYECSVSLCVRGGGE